MQEFPNFFGSGRLGLGNFIIASTCACLLPLTTHADNPGIDLDLGYTYDNNVTRGRRNERFEDSVLALSAGIDYKLALTSHTRLVFRGFLRGESFGEYDLLSNITGGVGATYQYRTSATLTAPTFGVFARTAVAEYQSVIRSSTLYSGGFSYNQSLTDRFSIAIVLAGSARESDSAVFDTRDGSLLFHFDYQTFARSTFYLDYQFLGGDAVSTGAPTLANVDAAYAVVADDAFGGTAANMFAYRIHAYTQVATLGWNVPVRSGHAFDAFVRFAHSDAGKSAGDYLSYYRTQVGIAYLARF